MPLDDESEGPESKNQGSGYSSKEPQHLPTRLSARVCDNAREKKCIGHHSGNFHLGVIDHVVGFVSCHWSPLQLGKINFSLT